MVDTLIFKFHIKQSTPRGRFCNESNVNWQCIQGMQVTIIELAYVCGHISVFRLGELCHVGFGPRSWDRERQLPVLELRW